MQAVSFARAATVPTIIGEDESGAELVVGWLRIQPMQGLLMPSETLNVSRTERTSHCELNYES